MNCDTEKTILSNKMASFLILSGCRIKKSKPDLKNKNKQVYFFIQDEHLDKMMNKYQDARTRLSELEIEFSK